MIVGVRQAAGGGRFRWPTPVKTFSMTMRAEELAMPVNGFDSKQTQPYASGSD